MNPKCKHDVEMSPKGIHDVGSRRTLTTVMFALEPVVHSGSRCTLITALALASVATTLTITLTTTLTITLTTTLTITRAGFRGTLKRLSGNFARANRLGLGLRSGFGLRLGLRASRGLGLKL